MSLFTTHWQRCGSALQTPCKRKGRSGSAVGARSSPWHRRGIAVAALRERNGINTPQCDRSTSAVDALWGRSDISMDSARSPCERRPLQLRPHGDHVRPRGAPTAFMWRSWRSHGVATASPRRSYGVPTARMYNAVPTPSHGAYFVHAQSARRRMVT